MKKKIPQKIKLSKSDLSLKIVAITITVISMLLILFPFALTISNAMKDNVKIYDVPPKILPDAANSLTLTVDYTGFTGSDSELESALQDDLVSSMFGIFTKLNRESIFEIKFYGVKDSKTIFYSRAHQIELQMEKDYGIYKGTVIKKDTLLYENRAEKAAKLLGYEFNPSGLSGHEAPSVMQAEIMEMLDEILAKKFPLKGELTACKSTQNNFLLLESFVHYMRLPQYMYSSNPIIAKYGFMVFVANTVLVIGFAIIAQVFLCLSLIHI